MVPFKVIAREKNLRWRLAETNIVIHKQLYVQNEKGEDDMNCPVCNIALVMSERQGVEIDYCPQCRGVWLDRGELDKIVERSTSETSQRPSRESDYDRRDSHHGKQHGDDHGDGHYKKKRSFLSELFD
jgi:Zn-finger nucleic acid-binding protein